MQLAPQSFGLTAEQLGLSSSPLFKAFEFCKPTHHDVAPGEVPRWVMVTSADKLDISSADIERRIKKTRDKKPKITALDEYNHLSKDMKFLVKRLVDESNLKEPDAMKEWSIELIETDKRLYKTTDAYRKEINTMRVYLKQSTKPELRALNRPDLRRTMSLGGTIDLSDPRLPNSYYPNNGYGIQATGFDVHGGAVMAPGGFGHAQVQAPHVQQPLNNVAHGGFVPGHGGPVINHPGPQGHAGQQAFTSGQGGAAKPTGKNNPPNGGSTGTAGLPAATNFKVMTNNKAADKKSGSKDHGRKRSKSRGARRRSRHDSDSSDSDSDRESVTSLTSSGSDRAHRGGDAKTMLRKLTKHVEAIDSRHRASAGAKLPRAPMAPTRRPSEYQTQPVRPRPSVQRRRTSPIAIEGRGAKMIERIYLSSDSDREHGYGSSGSRRSWVGGESAFSRPESDLTPPSSYGANAGLFGNPFEQHREHRRPGARSYPSPPLSPGASDFDYDYGHRRRSSRPQSGLHMSGAHAEYDEYFDAPQMRPSARGHEYRRKSEAALNRDIAREQREKRDRYMRDERYRQSSRAY